MLLKVLIENSRDGIVILEEDGRVYDSNDRYADLLGYTLEEMLQLHVWDWDDQFPREQLLEMLRNVDDSGDHFDTRQRRKDGTVIDVELSTNGTVYRGRKLILCIARDITDRRRAEEGRDRLIESIEALPDFFAYADPDGTLRYINAGGRRWVGLPVDGADSPLLHAPDGRPLHIRDFHPEEVYRRLQNVALPAAIRNGSWEGESALRDIRGRDTPVSQIVVAHLDGAGEVVRYSTLIRDISRYKAMEAELERLAFYDSLTGCYNRRQFEALLDQEVQRCQRYADRFALVMFDLDHFKAVNDNHGHQAGDAILRGIAGIVQGQLRASDAIGRWGGEEFMILLPTLDATQAAAVAEKVRAAIAATDFPGPRQVTVSLGVAEYRPGQSIRDLVKRVDEAVYRAKHQGRNQVVVDG